MSPPSTDLPPMVSRFPSSTAEGHQGQPLDQPSDSAQIVGKWRTCTVRLICVNPRSEPALNRLASSPSQSSVA